MVHLSIIDEIRNAWSAGLSAQEPARRLCHVLFDGLSESMGRPLDFEPETVHSPEGSVIAAGTTMLASGSTAPFPITLIVRLSVDFTCEGAPSVVAIVLLSSGTERLTLADHDYVWYELLSRGSKFVWECRGWAKDVYEEFAG